MIRKAGQKEDPVEWIDMMEERLRGMETLAATHITWYTHKNPYGCWICDMFLLSQRLIDSFREFLGPTPADATREEDSSNGQSTEQEDTEDSESYDEESATALEGEEL